MDTRDRVNGGNDRHDIASRSKLRMQRQVVEFRRPSILPVFAASVISVAVVTGCRDASTVTRVPAAGRGPSSSDTPGAARQSGGRFDRPPETRMEVERIRAIDEFPEGIAQFTTVFWEPDDTKSLRRLIRETDLVSGKRVLEIGTGTGLIALCCLRRDAASVVATDINPSAVANAEYNADRLRLSDRLETRWVNPRDPSAFSIARRDERFDLIISNPPWEDGEAESVDQYAFYDEDFALMQSLLEGADRHLNPGGKVLLAYGCVEAIRRIESLAPRYALRVRRLDDRRLDELPEVFLPGMLLELTREKTRS